MMVQFGLLVTILWLDATTRLPLEAIRAAYDKAFSAAWIQVLPLTRSPYPAVRYWAAKAARYRADVTDVVLDQLVPLLKDPDPVVAVAVAAALAARGRKNPEIDAAFVRALRDPQPGIRLEALSFLRELPEISDRFADEYRSIQQLGRSVPYEVQKLCTELLERIAGR